MQDQDRKVIKSLVFVLVIIAAELAWLILVGPPQVEANQQTNQEAYHWIREAIGSAAFWTAVFTGLLVWSTWLLWRSTSQSVGIAERALTELERPFVYAQVTNVSINISRLQKSGTATVLMHLGRFELSLLNFGRSPANLTRLEYEIRPAIHGGIAPVIDPKIVGGRELPVGTVSAPDHPFTESTELAKVPSLQGRDATLATGVESIWVTGFVRYRDIFGVNYITGFNLVFDLIGKQFVVRGDQKYNYARTEKPEEIPEPSSRG